LVTYRCWKFHKFGSLCISLAGDEGKLLKRLLIEIRDLELPSNRESFFYTLVENGNYVVLLYEYFEDEIDQVVEIGPFP
jgi:hypothetical protein